MVFHDGALSGDDPARHENPEDDTLEARCARWLAAAAADAVMSQCPCLADPDADEQVRTRPERRGGLENDDFFAIFFAPATSAFFVSHTARDGDKFRRRRARSFFIRRVLLALR